MSDFYILADDGRTPVVADMATWARWFEHHPTRTVQQDRLGDLLVSTVFLGIDHNFAGRGDPVLWETMVFRDGRSVDDGQDRYTSYADAVAGHADMRRRAEAGEFD